MSTAAEQYFPRGGYAKTEKQKKSSISKKHVASEKLFGENSRQSKKQKKNSQASSSLNLEPFTMSRNLVPDHVDSLTYQKIQEGMLLLGCVKNITTMNGVQVQLPGRCVGHVNIHEVSNEYPKYLADELEADTDVSLIRKPFQLGDFLPVKVLSKIKEDNGFRLILSSKPEHVNAHIQFNKVSQGMKLWASVIERSDHCYYLNAGIPNCRVVLPFNKSEFDYSAGQSVWCAIQQVNLHDQASILIVSTVEQDMQKVCVQKNTSLDVLIPGMAMPFQVQEVLNDGLRGTICQDCTAFIDATNLTKIKDFPQSYKIGQILNATLLYVISTNKFSYLNLQGTSNGASAPTIAIGAKMEGKVVTRKDRGIYISLKSDARGFVPYNRLNVRQHSKTTSNEPAKLVREIIAEAYPKNATFRVRVMDYNYMERVYICSNQVNDMNEQYFSLSDLKIGDTVEGIIKEIKTNGAVVSVGRIQGFIPNIHLCDVQFTDTIKTKLKIKQKITAKVLNLTPTNIYFTLKKSLLSNDLNLTTADQIDTSSNYPGVIVKITRKIIHVQFYGGFSGHLNVSDFKGQGNVNELFYIGQVIMTHILRIEDDVPVLTISLDDVNGNKRSAGKKRKNTTLSESSECNGTTKKAIVNAAYAADSDSMATDDSDEGRKGAEEKVKPILKWKAVDKKSAKLEDDEYREDQVIKKEASEETATKKRKSIISFADEPLVKTFNKSARPDPTAMCSKPLAVRGVSDFFATTSLRLNSDSDSDEGENIVEPTENANKKKKKRTAKQSAAEKREKERHEEDRLRAIETQLADGSSAPQSAEQFDRLLLGQPNSSMLWAQYIAFHMQSVEIEKARSTARRALQTICLTESQERLNIWTVCLNLEHAYGTKDSYDEIFKESLSRNNSLSIYLLSMEHHVIKGDMMEADTKWRKFKREHKDNLEMWIKVGKIYYENKRFEEARKLRDEGLKTIMDKTMQIDLIVKFAIFEFTYGDSGQGETLFETIVQSDPKRVNVWCTYIDQLVKKNDIDLARRVLDRAVGNKIPFKKMRTLFKKYYQFEKKHGDAEKQAYVEKLAKEYAFAVSAL